MVVNSATDCGGEETSAHEGRGLERALIARLLLAAEREVVAHVAATVVGRKDDERPVVHVLLAEKAHKSADPLICATQHARDLLPDALLSRNIMWKVIRRVR